MGVFSKASSWIKSSLSDKKNQSSNRESPKTHQNKVTSLVCFWGFAFKGNKMARNHKKDYEELPCFAEGFKNKTTLECIEAYAQKRKVVSHRIGKVFWALVDEGKIEIYHANARFFIK